jgi:NADH-quinone oxidoreductase subunit J
MQSNQILPLIGFYLFALLTVVSAFVVVFAKSIMRAVFALMFTLFGVAGLYISLHADFLAATQVLIYVGGVLVILIFGIMLTQRLVDADLRSGRIQLAPTLIALAILFGFLLLVIFNTPWNVQGPAQFQNSTFDIGTLLMTEWLLPFEVASILLLAALVGAVGIARPRKTIE